MTTTRPSDAIGERIAGYLDAAALHASTPDTVDLDQAWKYATQDLTTDEAAFLFATGMTAAAAGVMKVLNPCLDHSDMPAVPVFASIGDDGRPQRLDTDDAPPEAILAGRWLVAHLNDDVDTACALWASIPADPGVHQSLFRNIAHLTTTVVQTAVRAGVWS